MFSRFTRRLTLLGVGLLVLSLLALSAHEGSGNSAAKKRPSATATITAAAAGLGAATGPATAAAKSAGAKLTAAEATASTAAGAATSADADSAATVYGVSAPELLGEPTSEQIAELEAMKAMGMTSVRLDASWYWGQFNGPDSYNWAPLDQVVASIQQVGLSADLIIDGCPPWAAVPGAWGNQFAQPASSAAFATWAGAVAARYGTEGVKYFEIWNEPNLQGSWEPRPNPAAYTADLIAAYTAIKAVDPSAVVLSGGLAPAVNSARSYDPRTFLEDMYADGAGGSFDGLGDHPYSFPTDPDEEEAWSAWSQISETSPSLRSIMVQNGDSDKKIWITEYGAPTVGWGSVSKTEQSTELVQAINQVQQSWWIGSLYLYTWSDQSTLAAVDNGYGLLSAGNAQKPAYAAVTAALGS